VTLAVGDEIVAAAVSNEAQIDWPHITIKSFGLSSSDWHAVGRHDPAIAEGGQHTNVVCAIGGTIDVDVEASTIITQRIRHCSR